MRALFRGIFRCRHCGATHGAYGVQVARYEVWYPVVENRARADWCPRCGSLDCQYIGGTRIPPTIEMTVRKSNRTRGQGGLIEAKKAG